MKILKTMKVSDLKDQFSSIFPNLKVEFYTQSHLPGEGSSKDVQIPDEVHISSLYSGIENGSIEISPNMSVKEFEQRMKDQFGFNVQVFRKSGDLWLQTTKTDDWSLEKQNGKGGRSQLDHST